VSAAGEPEETGLVCTAGVSDQWVVGRKIATSRSPEHLNNCSAALRKEMP
jgi:hypothetical protein